MYVCTLVSLYTLQGSLIQGETNLMVLMPEKIIIMCYCPVPNLFVYAVMDYLIAVFIAYIYI